MEEIFNPVFQISYLRSWIDTEFKLRLLSIINRQSLHKQRSEPGSSSSTEGVEDQKSLETSALISQLTDSVQDKVNNLLADGVVTSGVVVGGIFLACNQLFRVE